MKRDLLLSSKHIYLIGREKVSMVKERNKERNISRAITRQLPIQLYLMHIVGILGYNALPARNVTPATTKD